MFDSIGGIPFSSVVIAIRFLGALWASVGIIYTLWGLTDYMLSHENAHHKNDARLKIATGFSILLGFFLVWGCVRIIIYFIPG